ncbi:nucleoside recognition domain-containing protein [Flavonifractor hominis]|uniref:Nucleoside recognition domain-containing protein n=1 Tax=Flavonifractor hominis TaxID=3133178 RepID=A0ABV1ES51_9FIRM
MSRLLSKERVRDLFLCLALLCATLALLLYPQPAMEAAKSGLKLCYNVIIPALFPFFVLSSLVVELGLAGYLGRLLEGVMRPLFGVNGACASAFALGFIGGYPVGAKTAISLYENGMCTRTEAERLLAFCNNSGPAFILGVVGAGVFASSRVGVLLYLAHAAASVCIGLLFRFYGSGSGSGRQEHAPRPHFQAQRFTVAFTGSIKQSFLSTLNICAFVVFFTVVIQLLIRSGCLPALAGALGTLLAPFGLTPEWAQRLLTGILEISSGVWTLSGDGSLPGRLTMAAFLLGWAGLSVHCQVLSFIGGSGLSVGTYLVGKLLHGGLSALFIAVLVRLIPLEAPVSDYLADQVAGIAGVDFSRALTLSLVSAWVVFLFYLLVAVVAAGKKLGKHRNYML